jgi:hypothetical protein
MAAGSVLKFSRRIAATERLKTKGVLRTTKRIAKRLSLRTLGRTLASALRVKLVAISIATTSVVSVIAHVLIGCIIAFATASSVTVAALRFLKKALLTLFGAQSALLLSARTALMNLFGARNTLEIGMSTETNGVFHRGESWVITGHAQDSSGSPLDLTGGTVQLRIVSDAAVALDLTTPTDGSIVTPLGGLYQFVITPAQQTALTLSAYAYEVRITLSDGEITVQNEGEITVKPSKFVNFP